LLRIRRRQSVPEGTAGTRVFSADDFLGRISPKSSAGKWGAVPGPQGGLHAHTDFTVLGEGVSGGTRVLYLEARPVTGRTHQIRVHLSSLGLPILGDSLYGGCAAERLFLHARSISFPHPVTGGILTVTAPLPPRILETDCRNVSSGFTAAGAHSIIKYAFPVEYA